MNDLQTDYERIVRPLEDRMISSIWRIVHHPSDAEDTLQNALTTIWRRWGRVVTHPNPEVLIIKICLDAAYDTLRRRIREQRHALTFLRRPESAVTPPSPEAELNCNELYAAVTAAINQLPRKQALATLLRVVQGQSYEQIAMALSSRQATARKHVERGRERLRILLARLESEKTVRNSP